MKTPTSHSRASLTATVLNHARWLGCLLVGAAMLGSNSALAAIWVGGTSTDWNVPANWSGAYSGIFSINTIPANIATISANFSTTPTSILIGNTTAGRVNHVAGNASVSTGNDLVLGRSTGGNGTYNLANTDATGGILTGFGQGSGNLTIPDQVFVGGSILAATGTLNIHTAGTLAVGTQLLVGNLGGTGTVKMDSGTLTVADDMEIGNGASSTGASSVGTFSMSGGTVTKSGATTAVTIGGGVTTNSLTTDGGTGTANLNGGTFTTAGVFRVGQNLISGSLHSSHGTLNLGGTNLTANGEFWVGNNTGATGTMTFSSGSLTVNNWVAIGRKDTANTGVGGTGTVTMTGGTWTKTGDSNFTVGSSGAGTMTMSGGLVVVGPSTVADRGITWIGEQNNSTGVLTISGSAEFRSSRFVMGVQSGTAGTLNLNGGTVKTSGLAGGAGTSTVNFNGTQIIALGATATFINTLNVAHLDVGGLKVDTNGFDLTIPQLLTGTGGVTKTGAGTLTLSGSNVYSGNHTVNAGTLAVSTDSSGIGGFTVANGAALLVNQTHDTSLTVANVSLGTSGAASLNLNLRNGVGNPTAAPLKVTGSLTLNGPITLNVSDVQPDIGTVPLVSYAAKSGFGSFVLGSLPLGAIATLTDDGIGLVSLNISALSFPLWRGTVDGNWDTATVNWIDQVTSTPSFYQNPAPVTFDDSATGPTALILDIPVSPANVTFHNITLVYTLNGIGKITGSTGLTKTGAASLAISTVDNDYTGATMLSGGTTTVGILTNGGVASPLGAATAEATNLALNGGTLEYTGGNVTIDRGIAISAAGGGILNAGNITLTGVVAAATGGNFRKTGAGMLNLTNAAVTLGAADIQAGTLAFTGPGQTVTIPGNITAGSPTNASTNLILQNRNLTVGGMTLLAQGANSTTTVTLGGNSVYTANSNIQIALNVTAVCNFTIQDSASLVHSGGWFSVGNDGTCTMTVKNNGSLSTVNADFNISDVGTSTATLNIQDNATVSATGNVFVGKNINTTGTLNMTGGTFNAASWVTTGRYVGGTGFFNLSGGTFNQTGTGQGFIVGENGTATLTVSGAGILNIDGGGLYLSAEGRGTSHSVAYLNGGTIIAKRVVQRDFNAANYTEFHFNGGILRAHTGASTDFMSQHDLVTVDSGGAFIDSNGQTITIAQALGGSGGLTKQGAGTLTLTGANTYAGPTTVTAGTLSMSNACFADTAAVTIATGAVLNLTHGLTDQIGRLTIGGISLPVGIYDATTHPGVITGTGKLQVNLTASAYETWIAGYGLDPNGDGAPGVDKDGDGQNNLLEFALGGSPVSGSNNAKIFNLIADSNVDGDAIPELLLTIAVRAGTPAFTGSPSPTATRDGVTYTIEGSSTLSTFLTGVTQVGTVAPPAPNATPPAGYEYRTFSLSGSNGLAGAGFLRVKVE